MWYDINEDCWLNTESALWGRLKEIAENHKESFDPDELIDEMYEPVEYFGVVFSPCRIIRKLDNELYQEICNNLIDDWVEETMYVLERMSPKEGDTIANFRTHSYCFSELEEIVWKE